MSSIRYLLPRLDYCDPQRLNASDFNP
jgi:hypothetical protein